jgi:hypothetical protein
VTEGDLTGYQDLALPIRDLAGRSENFLNVPESLLGRTPALVWLNPTGPRPPRLLDEG